MSTFYLLPSRPVLGERFAAYLQTLFPGISWPAADWPELAERLGETVSRPGVYVVYGDELPPGADPVQALAEGFGAEPDDEIIEVKAGILRDRGET